jgi:hypothetical protein
LNPLKTPIRDAIHAWRFALQGRSFRIQIIISLVVLLGCGWVAPRLFQYIQHRQGILLSDPLLESLPAVDLSIPIFAILYTLILASVLVLLTKPVKLLIALQAYTVLTILRFITLYCVALEPPGQLVPLSDPLVNLFFYQEIVTKDLFFSGHTSILVLLGVCLPGRWLKTLLFLGALAIGTMVLLQHVHYTIDVLAAPMFAALAYYGVTKFPTSTR